MFHNIIYISLLGPGYLRTLVVLVIDVDNNKFLNLEIYVLVLVTSQQIFNDFLKMTCIFDIYFSLMLQWYWNLIINWHFYLPFYPSQVAEDLI